MSHEGEEWLKKWYEENQLFIAAGEGDLQKIKELISHGFEVNVFDDYSCTPLHCAAEKGHIDHLVPTRFDSLSSVLSCCQTS